MKTTRFTTKRTDEGLELYEGGRRIAVFCGFEESIEWLVCAVNAASGYTAAELRMLEEARKSFMARHGIE